MTKWVDAPVIGGAYSDDTRPWSVQDTVNYIPVAAERPGTRSMKMLRGAPGLVPFADLGTDAPIRGMRNVEGLLLAVSSNKLFKIAPTAAVTDLGDIPGVSRVSMAHNQITNGNQVAIANGVGGYVYNTTSGVLAPITDPGFPGAISFDYADSYITGIEPGRRFAFTSDLADATSYNTLDEYEAEGSPDLLVGQIVTHREWWLFGKRTIEPYQNTGASTGTWQRASGTVLEVGAASPYAIVNLDNSVFWLGNDGIVYRANGYTPVPVSTRPIEQAISQCDLTKAFAFTYEDRGHKIFYLTFQDGKTWGYDVTTQEWHRRKSKSLDRWRINALVEWNGMWIAGDYQNGKLYRLDWSVATEDGQTLERRRITGVLHDNQNPVIVNAIALVFDTGQPQTEYPGIPLNITGNAPAGTVGISYSYHYLATGGTAPLAYAIVIGELPDGITLDEGTGTISGTPTTVTDPTSFRVQVTDHDGSTAYVDDSIAVISVAFESVVLSDIPILYLPLNETSGSIASDLTGNNHNGTYSGSLVHSPVELRPGSRCLQVGNSGNGWVTIPDRGYGTLFEGTSWSVEVIAHRLGSGGGSSESIFGKYKSPNLGYVQFAIQGVQSLPDKPLGQMYQNNDGQIAVASDGTELSSPAIYGLERDGTSLNFYINGSIAGSMAASLPGEDNGSQPLTIGGEPNFPTSYQFNGYISDASVYDHALGEERFLAHAQAAGFA